MRDSSKDTRKEIITFLGLTFLLSSIFYYLITYSDALESISLGLMWCPGIAAIVTRVIYNRNIRGLGWGPGNGKYLIFALFLPLLLCLVEYAPVWLFAPDRFDHQFAREFLVPRKWLWVVVNLFGNLVFALGEEIGWRGYFVPQLSRLTSFTKTVIISGFIWAVWHFPVIIYTDYGIDIPIPYALLIFTLGLIMNSFIFTWFTLKSGSVWPAVVLHGAGNFFVQNIFERLLITGHGPNYLTGEFGVVGGVVLFVAAIIFWRLKNRLPKESPASFG